MNVSRLLLASVLISGWCVGSVGAQDNPVAELRVFPADINLLTAKDRQLLVVQAVYASGLTQDVTSQATMTLANPALCRKEGNTFWGAADGATELKVEFGGKAMTVPVKVEKAVEPRPISFKLDIMPIFMKAVAHISPAEVIAHRVIWSIPTPISLSHKQCTFW